MKYRQLGQSGVEVSTLCLGAMMFGGAADAAESERIVATARDGGVNFMDTADVYTDGGSERIVGHAIKGDRDHWMLATKAGNALEGVADSGGA